ncbi:hypothetical protein IAU60_004896 [Kwoniella sp. DSM 27419]
MVAAGVPGFTPLALVNVRKASLEILPGSDLFHRQTVDSQLAAEIFFVAGHWIGLLMTGFFVWIVMFMMGMISCWGVWAETFPSKAFGVRNVAIGTSSSIYHATYLYIPEKLVEPGDLKGDAELHIRHVLGRDEESSDCLACSLPGQGERGVTDSTAVTFVDGLDQGGVWK